MLLTTSEAQTKWCPFTRIDNSNREFAMLTQGPEQGNKLYHCIGNACMAWREYHLSHLKGSGAGEAHGYCGLAGKPERDESW